MIAPAVVAAAIPEVTRSQFATFVAEEGYEPDWQCITWDFEAKRWGARGTLWTWSDPGFEQGPDHPVVCVSFTDAQAYAEWLSARTDERYRLLDDDEWEYVARDRSQRARPWEDENGPERKDACAHANVMDQDAADRLGVDSAKRDWAPFFLRSARVGLRIARDLH